MDKEYRRLLLGFAAFLLFGIGLAIRHGVIIGVSMGVAVSAAVILLLRELRV